MKMRPRDSRALFLCLLVLLRQAREYTEPKGEKNMEQTRPILKSILTGSVASLVSVILLSIIAAMLISKEVLPEESISTMGIITSILAAFMGAILAGRIQRSKLLLTCAGSAAAYLALTLLAKAAFIGKWDRISFPVILGILAAGIAASFVPQGRGPVRKRR